MKFFNLSQEKVYAENNQAIFSKISRKNMKKPTLKL